MRFAGGGHLAQWQRQAGAASPCEPYGLFTFLATVTVFLSDIPDRA
jgi:hypothetical protein